MRRNLPGHVTLLFCLIGAGAAQITPLPQNPNPGTRGQSRADELEDSWERPRLPKGTVSLMGGTVATVDPIRDRIVLRAFGGRDVTIDFDTRTQVLRGTTVVSSRDIRPGTRIYADTIMIAGRMFAKTLRLEGNGTAGETEGQILEYNWSKQLLRVRDSISQEPVLVRLTSRSQLMLGGEPARSTSLMEGTVVAIRFRASAEGPSEAERIDILAQPGSSYTFTGTIAVVDLHDEHMTLVEPEHQNTFEVALGSLPRQSKASLRTGMQVTVRARFDGHKYLAESVEPVRSAQEPLQAPQ